MNNSYTVVGYYIDTCEIFCAHVTADNEVEAVTKVPDFFKGDAETGPDEDNMAVVAIFEGYHNDLNENNTVSVISDWPVEIEKKGF